MKRQKFSTFAKKTVNVLMIKIFVKLLKTTVIILIYRGAAHSIFNLKYGIFKVTPIVPHNGSNYEYH